MKVSMRSVARLCGLGMLAGIAALAVAATPAAARDHSHFSFGIGVSDFGYGGATSGFFSFSDRGSRIGVRWDDGRRGYRGGRGWRDPWRHDRRFGSSWGPRYDYRPYPRYWRPAPPMWGWDPYPRYWRGSNVVILGLFPGYFSARFSDDYRTRHHSAYARAMTTPVGATVVWNAGRANGEITTTRDGYAGSRYCREFLQRVVIDGEQQEAYGTACQTPDGGWQLVANQP